MTIFIDGPAANDDGKPLLLRRAPHFLRAVIAPDGAIDALDQLTDLPEAHERVVAYEMVEGPTRAIVCVRGRNRSGGGWYEGGRYRMVVDQPADDVLRSNKLWRAWCSQRIGKPIATDGTVEGLSGER